MVPQGVRSERTVLKALPIGDETVDGPAHDTLGAIAGGKITYTPDGGYHGEDSFTYRASDGELESSPATVTLTVVAPPTVSLAVDHASAVKGARLKFIATADDPDGGSIDEYRYRVDGAVVQTGGSPSLCRRFDTPGSPTVAVRAKAAAKKLKLGKKAVVVGTLTRSLSVKLSVRAIATDAAGNAARIVRPLTVRK